MQKIAIALLVIILLLSLASRAFADPMNYSQEANSGVRHEVCTTLDGTSVDTYYTGQYTFDTLSGLYGDDLLQTLRTLMVTTHTYQTSYDQCRDLAVKTDCENGDGVTINLMYSSFVTDFQGYINHTSKGWNREHVWPKSLGGFNTTGAGADLHHIRPTDSSLNGTRGNDKYGNVEGGREIYGTVVTGGAHGGKKGGGYMEPLDNAKGDVARICLYVWVRYGGELSKCSSITNVFQSIDVLLQWHELDPVDTWEMGRNEVVYGIQGNRNVFIDYPELAWQIFDREVPEDVVTPSANDKRCEHQNVEARNQKDATCAEEGHSGDMYCVDCGKLVAGGSVIPTTEHKNTEIRNAWDAVCNMVGSTGDIYCLDCGKLVKVGVLIPATGEHKFSDWVSNEDLSCRTCVVCHFEEVKYHEETDTRRMDPVIICIAAGSVVVVSGGVTAAILVIRKKKHA